MTEAVWRFKYRKFGKHIHCVIYVASAWDQTFANTGRLVMSPEEFDDFMRRLVGTDTEFINNDN